MSNRTGSVFSPAARADPNSLETNKEKIVRTLDPRIDGKYSKRMSFAYKDIHNDPELLRQNQNELMIQSFAAKEAQKKDRYDQLIGES